MSFSATSEELSDPIVEKKNGEREQVITVRMTIIKKKKKWTQKRERLFDFSSFLLALVVCELEVEKTETNFTSKALTIKGRLYLWTFPPNSRKSHLALFLALVFAKC